MLSPGSDTKIYLCIGYTDMRKGANGLSLLAESILGDHPKPEGMLNLYKKTIYQKF